MTVPPTKPSLLNALPVPVTAPLSLKGGGDIPTKHFGADHEVSACELASWESVGDQDSGARGSYRRSDQRVARREWVIYCRADGAEPPSPNGLIQSLTLLLSESGFRTLINRVTARNACSGHQGMGGNQDDCPPSND